MPGRLTSMGMVLLESAPPGRAQLRALAASVALALAIGAVDFFVTYRVQLTVLYLLPIFIATWNVNLRAGSALALLSALASSAGEVLGDLPSRSWLVLAFRFVLSTLLFAAFAVLLAVLRRALDREKEFARTDPLTGVSNRRHFVDLAASDLALARRYQRPLTVAYIDLDDFKDVNDRLGHRAGDELLRTVARAIRRRLRVTDAVGRLGGDEFAVCLPETGPDAATKVLGKLRDDVTSALPESCRFVTLSIGMVTFAYPPATVEELIERTDFVLYAAKREGKNRLIHEVVPA